MGKRRRCVPTVSCESGLEKYVSLIWSAMVAACLTHTSLARFNLLMFMLAAKHEVLSELSQRILFSTLPPRCMILLLYISLLKLLCVRFCLLLTVLYSTFVYSVEYWRP